LNGTGADYDIVETILIESSDTHPRVSIQSEESEATTAAAAANEQNDSYFNNKLKKLYKDLDATLRMSYKMLNRNSLDGRMNQQQQSGTGEECTRIVSNRIYLAGQPNEEEGSLDTSDSSAKSEVLQAVAEDAVVEVVAETINVDDLKQDETGSVQASSSVVR
jgi:hypothetical protein